ncbi:MAG: thioesterase family protein [Verrucomicrobiota bacterium]|nr:thioesterase family protein [Verrucomicrobiota bacterium]
MSNVFTYTSEVYFDELDGLGFLHHTRYLLHLELAQQRFFEQLLGVTDFDADRDEDIYVVVHGLEARFRVPLSKPGKIIVDYQITKIRSCGVIMDFTIRASEGKTVYCTGTRTLCKLSAETHRPAPWTNAFRAAMEAY